MERNPANYVPLSPLSLLRRTAAVHPKRIAIIHGDHRQTWKETAERCARLAAALSAAGVGKGDTVAVMAPNIPAFVEAHFGVPMCGAVLNSLNIRLDSAALAFILKHGEAKVLLTDREFSSVVSEALAQLDEKPLVIDIDDPLATGGDLIGALDYEAFLHTGAPDYVPPELEDEWDAIALNYTSGTTGDPKGVVYHHRGAYLNAIGNAVTWSMPHYPVYLWTLPMFHCNGWCFPWTITALAGTHVCLRRVEGKAILEAIAEHGVTHLCGAPIVMSMMAAVAEANRPTLSRQVRMMTAGASPPAAVIKAIEAMSIDITHVYGLTEVYGPCVVCAWQPEWDGLTVDEKARIKARQGIAYEMQEGVMVADPETLKPLPWDGETMGEVMIRGNIMMKGYLKNAATTEKSFEGGWYRTGDLAVQHPDGYLEIKDRSKDIIISGGENISSIEVEDVLYALDGVAAAAVVAMPHEKWGETPCAVIELKPGARLTSEQVIAHCRERLARFKCPTVIRFEGIPKTSTGKVQKFELRERVARAAGQTVPADAAATT
ncbi:acyl-CoA synthetase [Sphingobium chungbukense]|nr:acyl-CoA synthetase [Sphingobium chungbukense]